MRIKTTSHGLKNYSELRIRRSICCEKHFVLLQLGRAVVRISKNMDFD